MTDLNNQKNTISHAQIINYVLFSILTALAGQAVHYIAKMNDSVSDLSLKMAVVIEQVARHEVEIQALREQELIKGKTRRGR